MKTCVDCNMEKQLTEFYRDKGMADGRRNNCKSCKDKKVLTARGRNREKWNEYMRKFRKEHPLSMKDKIHKRNRVMRCRYGIDMGGYDEILISQGGMCAMCGLPPKPNRFLVVDHNHDTGKVRALLHDGCNVAIAILDNPDLLAKAQAYIAKHVQS